MPTQKPTKKRLQAPRLSGWLLMTLVLLIGVWAIAPQQLPVSLYKLSLVTLAAVVGYWLDRSLFPYARPDLFLELDENMQPDLPLDRVADAELLRLMGQAMLRRAIIVGCAMLAMGLGA